MKKTKEEAEHEKLKEQDKESQEHLQHSPIIISVDTSFVSFSLSREELATLTNLLGVTAKTFESLALQAAQQNDEELFKILSARHKLSNHFVSKLIEFYKMPEPLSKELH